MKKTAMRLASYLVGGFRFLFSDIIVNRKCEEKKGTNIKFLLNDVKVLLRLGRKFVLPRLKPDVQYPQRYLLNFYIFWQGKTLV